MSIIKHVTLQKIVAHDFRYDPRTYQGSFFLDSDIRNIILKSIWNLLRVIKGVQLLGFQSKGYKRSVKSLRASGRTGFESVIYSKHGSRIQGYSE